MQVQVLNYRWGIDNVGLCCLPLTLSVQVSKEINSICYHRPTSGPISGMTVCQETTFSRTTVYRVRTNNLYSYTITMVLWSEGYTLTDLLKVLHSCKRHPQR